MQEQLKGVVSRLVYSSPTGGAIFRLLPDRGARTFRVVANYRAMSISPNVGETWLLFGHFKIDAKFGEQFYADSAVQQIPAGHAIVSLLSTHPRFSDVGSILAKRLWRKLGIQLYQVLATGNFPLLCSAGLKPNMAIRLIRAWRDYTLFVETLSYFAAQKLPPHLVTRAIQHWGREAVERIHINPYLLVPFSSWKVIDDPSRETFGFAAEDPKRLVAACITVLEESVRRHHSSVMTPKIFRQRLAARLGKKDLVECAINHAVTEGEVIWIRDEGKLHAQSRGMAIIEAAVRRKIEVLGRHFQEELSARVNSNVPMQFRDVLEVPLGLAKMNKSLLARPGLTVIQAGPIQSVVRISQLAGASVFHLFPSESLRRYATPLLLEHTALLADVLTGKLVFENEAPDLIYIYDSNCLDIIAANKLLYLLPRSAGVCFIGSFECAFPPGPGLFFHLLTKYSTLNLHSNTDNLRELKAPSVSVHDDSLHRAGPRVTCGESVPYPQRIRHIRIPAESNLFSIILPAYREAAEQGTAVIVTESWRTAQIFNFRLHDELVELRQFNKLPIPHVRLRGSAEATVGDTIAFRGQEYWKGLMLGSRGPIVEIYTSPEVAVTEDGTIKVIIAKADIDTVGIISLTAIDCLQFSLGYATLPGLSQWSIFEQVLICLESKRVIDQRWLETLNFRSEKPLAVIGSDEQLEAAKNGNFIKPRIVGLVL